MDTLSCPRCGRASLRHDGAADLYRDMLACPCGYRTYVDRAMRDARREGEKAANAGMEAAARAAGQAWMDHALAVLRGLVADRGQLTPDDLHVELDRLGVGVPNPNALGVVFRRARDQGILEWTGQVVRSSRAARRGSMVRLYQTNRAKEAHDESTTHERHADHRAGPGR